MNTASPSNDAFTGQVVLPYRREDIEAAERSIFQEVERHGYTHASLFAVRLSLEEALSNAFKHGNKGDAHKVVRLAYQVTDDAVILDITDEGEGFDPQSIPDPTDQENLEIPCGRGLKLIRSFMTEVQIFPPGNRLRMTYAKPAE